jgi:uncharacterized protein (TIGR03083 family)
MSNDHPNSRADLLSRIAAGRAELDAYIAGLSEAQIGAAGPCDDWSIKDHLYHLGGWEGKLLAQLRGEPIPAALEIDQATWEGEDIDAINAALRGRGRDLPVADALARYEQSHQRLLAELHRYPEAAYARPGYPDLPDSAPMIGYIAGNTYEHYREHLGYIVALAR